MFNRVSKRIEVREMIADCFERAVRQVGEAEARRLLLGVLKQKAGSKPHRLPVVAATDRPITGPRTGTTMSALAFLERTGRLPTGDPPWDLSET